MRFFKYLIFILFSTITTQIYADLFYYANNKTRTFLSAQSACDHAMNAEISAKKNVLLQIDSGVYTCELQTQNGLYLSKTNIYKLEQTKCPSSGMPQATYFANNSPIPTQTCKQNPDGTFCIANYKGSSSPNNPLVIGTNAGQQIILNSVSEIPSPSCTPLFSKSSCDSKDPYGGCYKPPNDSCNRLSDGSIYCPPDTPEPDISNTCNGATYCKRPPQGCGTGYVSGSFNGQQICVKTNPSTDTGEGSEDDESGTGSNTSDGTGTSTTTGTETSTTTNSDGSSTTTNTTTNNTTVNNFKIDFSPVVSAVKQVSADIKNLKNELLTSISELSKKLDLTNSKIDTTNIKIDETNSKLDVSNTNLTSIKDSSLRQEELLKSIRDKSGSGSASGAQTDTDLSGVNSRLDGIKEGIDKKNTFDKEFSDWMKEPIKESDYAQDMPTNSLEIADLNTTLYKLTGSCPAPFTFTAPVVNHTFTIDISRFCDVLAIIGILISIAACIHGIAILAENT